MVRAASRTLPAELLAKATAAAELHLRPVPGTVYELERVRDGPHGRWRAPKAVTKAGGNEIA